MSGYEHHKIHQISQGLFTIGFRSKKRIELDFESTTKTISQIFLEIQVHFVPYPDPYPFHTRIMPCRTHPPSPPFVDIQVYSTSSSSSSSSDSDSDDWKRKRVLAYSSCPTVWWNMCICVSIIYDYICMYYFYMFILYLNNIMSIFISM